MAAEAWLKVIVSSKALVQEVCTVSLNASGSGAVTHQVDYPSLWIQVFEADAHQCQHAVERTNRHWHPVMEAQRKNTVKRTIGLFHTQNPPLTGV